MNKIMVKKCLCGILFLLVFLLYSAFGYATEEIGRYRIQVATSTTAQEAESVQQNIASLYPALEYIASLGYSVSAYITSSIGEYKVYVGNYPTYGETRYISRELVKQGYQIAIEQIKEPIPDPVTIIGTADAIYSQASTFESEKDYSRAIAYYTTFINLYPTESRSNRTIIQLGICKTKLNDWAGALIAFQTVVNSDSPLAAEAQWRIGYTYLALYQLDSAQAAFAMVTARFPDSTVAAEAKERLKVFVSSGPDDALYKQAMFAIAAKKYPQAIEYLRQYTTSYPTAARIDEAYLRLANCNLIIGNKLGAFDGYKQVIQYPESRFAKDACGELAKLAVSLESTEYIDSAIDALRQSPCLNPANQELGGFFQTYISRG
ncbi:MAG: tetratricopeptide repeat protein [bacterium]|nr:tetratricopeptide repeat protein [bacterium]